MHGKATPHVYDPAAAAALAERKAKEDGGTYTRKDLAEAQPWWRRGGAYVTDADRKRAAEIAAEHERRSATSEVTRTRTPTAEEFVDGIFVPEEGASASARRVARRYERLHNLPEGTVTVELVDGRYVVT